MPDFDFVWKEALEAFFVPFMAFFFAFTHRDIDWSRGFEMLDKEMQQITPESERGRRLADKLIKVWRANGKDEWVLVHIEVQSQQDRDFAERMFVYNYRSFDRYNRRVASFAILGDSRPVWRPDRFGYELWGTRVGIEFATVKLLDFAADEADLDLHPNPFAVVVQAHLKTLEMAHDAEARRLAEVRLVKGLYARGFSGEQIRQLYRLIDGMMDLPMDLADLAWKEIRDFEMEKNMPFITAAERAGLEKGLAVGRAEGLQEGLARGLKDARENLLAGLEETLELRFAAAGLALIPEIRQIDELELLHKILRAIKSSETPDSLRRIWSEV